MAMTSDPEGHDLYTPTGYPRVTRQAEEMAVGREPTVPPKSWPCRNPQCANVVHFLSIPFCADCAHRLPWQLVRTLQSAFSPAFGRDPALNRQSKAFKDALAEARAILGARAP